MRDLIVYPDDYIIDEESEVLVHGFYVKIEGEGLFKEENHKIRCLRCIKRHIALKGIEVYAIKCTDNFLLLMVGNCTYCDIQQALRIFYSSYLVFYEKTFNSDCNHKTFY